jgi:hypothetical protein
MIRHLWRLLRGTFRRIRERLPRAKAKRIDRHYVSEFQVFMTRFLEEHPEVPGDQARGRGMYWDKKLDLDALDKAAEDSVPAEPYSYYRPLTGPEKPSPEDHSEPDKETPAS